MLSTAGRFATFFLATVSSIALANAEPDPKDAQPKPASAGEGKLSFNVVMTDRNETAGVQLTVATMFSRMAPLDEVDATIQGPRALILAMLFMKMPLEELEVAGLDVTGNREAVKSWLDAIDPLATEGFNIVEP